MKDTDRHIEKIQLQSWLAKQPGERLYQFLTDNDTMHKALIDVKGKLNRPADQLITDKKNLQNSN